MLRVKMCRAPTKESFIIIIQIIIIRYKQYIIIYIYMYIYQSILLLIYCIIDD